MQVLDHGSLDLMLTHGDDMLVVNAARVSFGNEDWFGRVAGEGEVKLINYLAKHKHVSPFYHPQLTFRVKLPISLHRQWERHRIGTAANSQSSRYSEMIDEVYLPSAYRAQSKSNKQGSAGVLEGKAWRLDNQGHSLESTYRFAEPNSWLEFYDEVSIQDGISWMDQELKKHAFAVYQKKIELGVAKEQARGMLPLDTYTAMVWTASLAAVWHFIELRIDSHAQWEIQEYARAMKDLVEPIFPISLKALATYGTP